MKNNYNQLIYKWWAPIYDHLFNRGKFLQAREEIFTNDDFKKEDRILFVGVGTGADIELLNYMELTITAIDYSPDMLGKVREKFQHSPVQLIEMDALNMTFVDYVIASLILSVVPDSIKALSEMERVSKEKGKILIFDKFATNQKSSLLFRIVRPIIRLAGTDIGLCFKDIVAHSNRLSIIENSPVMFAGRYRKILLEKK